MMKPRFLNFITISIGGLSAVFVSALLYGQYAFSHPNPGYFRGALVIFCCLMLGALSQLGLIISPLILGQHFLVRLTVLLSMVPFLYVFVLHDLIEVIQSLNPLTGIAIERWKYDLWGSSLSLASVVAWLFAYMFGIFRLFWLASRKDR